MPMLPEKIFNSLIDKNSLAKLINEHQTEGLYLEFKQKRDSRDGILHEDDKENFADGLSQFANSDGGVQVWGIETKKPGDIAFKLKPIKDVNIFADRLRSFLKDAAQPIVDGVLVDIIYENNGKEAGYIKVLVPRSDKAPHRSMINREYYKRNVQGRYRLEHFDLEDMFGRRQKPLLVFSAQVKGINNFTNLLTQADEHGYLPSVVFELYVINNGRAIGRDSMAIIWFPDEKVFKHELRVREIRHSRIDEMHGNKPTIQLNMRSLLFYPAVRTRIGELSVNFHKDHLEVIETSIGWKIHADNMLTKEGVADLLVKK